MGTVFFAMASWSDDEWEDTTATTTKTKEDLDVPDDSSDEEADRAKAKAKVEDSNTKVLSKNSFDELELNLQQDVSKLVQLILPKVKDSQAKGAPNKFLVESFKGLQVKLSFAETEALHKTCKELHTKRKKQQQE